MVKIELGKRDSILFALVVVLIGVGFAYAYGGTNPSVMGHSAGEIESIPWSKITGIPAGFADGVDDAGNVTEADPSVPSWVKIGTSSCGTLWETRTVFGSDELYQMCTPAGWKTVYSVNRVGGQ